jgi:Tfp pilus assembly protein PilN
MKAVNLVPADLRATPRGKVTVAPAAPAPAREGGIGAYVLLAVLALGVATLAAWTLTGNALAARQTELSDLTARTADITARTAALKPYADFRTAVQARTKVVHDLAAARFDWHQALRDLSRAIPRDVTVKTLQGSVTPGSGSGSDPLRAGRAVPAMVLTGCTRDQADVARLLSRLRNVDGVTRVSLSQSEKDGTGGVAAPTGKDVPGCRPGAPQFSLVAFFEHATAATAAPGLAGATPAAPGAAAAAATPTPTPVPGASR